MLWLFAATCGPEPPTLSKEPSSCWRAPRRVRGNPRNQALQPTAAALRDFEAPFRLGRHSAAERTWREALPFTTPRPDREFLPPRLPPPRPTEGPPPTTKQP